MSDPFRAATLSTAAVMLPQETEVIPAAIIPAGEMPAAEASSGVVQASYESDILLEATAVDAALPDPDTDALTLNDCITIAMRRQPRLQVELENVTRASLAGDISSAAFLPLVSAGYSVGEFGVNVGGIGIPIPGAPAAQGTYVPQQGFLPIGFDYNTTYVLTEARIQWLITDFGRRLGVHRQAGLAEEISRLKSARARQTVAHEVTLAYYELLRAESLFDIADESVARLESELKTIRKLKQGGLLEKEKVLRAEVALSKALKLRDSAEAAQRIASGSLNLAMGTPQHQPTPVQGVATVPAVERDATGYLAEAVRSRREFAVARRTVAIADSSRQVAKLGFALKVFANGFYFNFQANEPGGYVDVPLGFINLEWGVYEGGKRVAEIRRVSSEVRSAMLQTEVLANTIAFQVNECYQQVVAAERSISRSPKPVEQTQETYRIVKARSREGDATAAEVFEAETAVTQAEQEYQNAIYDYLLALARLEYATGADIGCHALTADPLALPVNGEVGGPATPRENPSERLPPPAAIKTPPPALQEARDD
ncbi:MAG: TolC family protein [Pirellulales bacterium]|nr:TolC family protein [Pirellulales bacterium]MBL7192666.1 TolC family protein [Pirellulales bacterium]